MLVLVDCIEVFPYLIRSWTELSYRITGICWFITLPDDGGLLFDSNRFEVEDACDVTVICDYFNGLL